MTRCLDVGIKLCGDTAESYVDDIPAISSNLVRALKDDDLQKFSNFFTDIKDAAYLKFLTDCEMEFQREKSFNHIVAETLPFSVDRERTLFSDTKIIGYRQMLPFHRFVTYYIDSLGFFVHQAGDIEVVIIDLVTNKILKTIPHTLPTGLVTLEINEEIENEFQSDLFVGVRNISAVLASMHCKELSDCNCDYTCDCEYDYGIFTNSVFNKESLEYQEHKFFCLNATVKCSFEQIICTYKQYFAQAYKYQVAIHILNEKLNSYQRGWWADANTQTVRDVTLPATTDYYNRLLNMAFNNIKGITNDSICFSCEGTSNEKPQLSSYV